MMVTIESACGRKTTKMDAYDADLNPHGFMCCGECITLIESRDAWRELAMSDLRGMI